MEILSGPKAHKSARPGDTNHGWSRPLYVTRSAPADTLCQRSRKAIITQGDAINAILG